MCQEYNGWTNRETWALMLWINNDERLQSEALDIMRVCARMPDKARAHNAPLALEGWAETLFTRAGYVEEFGAPWPDALADIAEDIGSLYRVNWYECAESLLRDIAEAEEYANA